MIKRRIKKYITLILFPIAFAIQFIACCDYKYDLELTHLNDLEKELFESFQNDDIQSFKNSKGQIDSIQMIGMKKESIKGSKCFISVKPSFTYSQEIKVYPNSIGLDKNFPDDLQQNIISITKFPLENLTSYSFNFMDFYYQTTDLGNYYKRSLSINGVEFKNIYFIENDEFSNSTNQYVVALIFNLKKGLIGYCTRENNLFRLITISH